MADDFTRRKLKWLDQLSRDLSVSHAGFRLAYALSGHFNHDSGEAWPTQATLAAALGVSDRTVRTLTEELASQGYLSVKSGRGRHQSNRFSMVAANRKPASPLSGDENRKSASDYEGSENRKPTSGLDDENRKPTSVFDAEKTGNLASENRKPASKKAEAHFRRNTFKNTSQEHLESISIENEGCHPGKNVSEKRRPSAPKKGQPKASEADFETWWKQYPRHVAKGAAQKLYERIVASGKATAAELMAGALRYAAERTGQDPQFTKHPSTWLNGGCWADEPQARAPAQPKAPRPLNHAAVGGMSAVDGILGSGEDDFP
jgi:hypothetical protein